MSADVAARLRQLAQDHHNGRLDITAYRALRAPLLDALVVSGVVSAPAVAALEVTQPRALSGGASLAAGVTASAGAALSAGAQLSVGALPSARAARSVRARAPNSPPLSVVLTLLALLVLVAAAFWFLHGRATTGSPAPTVATQAGSDQVLDLVETFSERGDWSDGRLASVNAALLELGGAQIAAVGRDARFQRFVDELRVHLKEQQALAPAPLTAANSLLAALAVTVGIDLSSPDSALHLTALPPPPESDRVEGRVATDARASAAPMARVAADHVRPPVEPLPSASAPPVQSATPQELPASSPNLPATATATATETAVSEQTTCRPDLIRSRRPLCHDTLPGGADAPLLALIPPGSFDMGSNAAPDEQPVHRVTLREPFAISVYEVSQGEFKEYCAHAPRPCAPQPWSGDDYPVVNVSWEDARAYTAWLSEVTHRHYSLPTEAQWEYAARAGRTGLFPSGDALSATDAQFSGPTTKQGVAARRGQTFNANAFRLLHMVGNVREWVEDTWTPNFTGAPNDGAAVKAGQTAAHVVRGGSYADSVARLRLSMRESLPTNTRDITTGFRITRELP